MRARAVIVEESPPNPEAACAAKVLRFFGVTAATVRLEDLVDGSCDLPDGAHLVCSADAFATLIAAHDGGRFAGRAWRDRFASAFVYAGHHRTALQASLNAVAGAAAGVVDADTRSTHWSVSAREPDICGVMSGVRSADLAQAGGQAFVVPPSEGNTLPLVMRGETATFVRGLWDGVPIFLSAASNIVDLDERIRTQNFDVRTQFMEAVPLVLYIRATCADTAWRLAEPTACVVIDDPLLTPQYGCVNYRRLSELMERHNFATSIAFIPWNRRRSSPRVVRLFKEHEKRYSLSIHGCDHTGGEFGISDENRLNWKAAQAIDRMAEHEAATGIRHDHVMVFPQGVFSDAAMGVLKHAGYLAAVNTEVISADAEPLPVSIAETWDVAVMQYQTFPIFTRRYPSQGIENYAFDLLLGKPCIIVIHHDFCADGYERLVGCIDQLNALNCRLKWSSLRDVVQSSYREREETARTVLVDLYGAGTVVRNRNHEARRFTVRKRESEPAAIERIIAAGREVSWVREGTHIRFDLDLEPEQHCAVRVVYRLRSAQPAPESMRARFKALARRRLSEVRDNYVVRPYLTASNHLRHGHRAVRSGQ